MGSSTVKKMPPSGGGGLSLLIKHPLFLFPLFSPQIRPPPLPWEGKGSEPPAGLSFWAPLGPDHLFHTPDPSLPRVAPLLLSEALSGPRALGPGSQRRPLDFGGVPRSGLVAVHPEFRERGKNSFAISQHGRGASTMRLIQLPPLPTEGQG